MRSITSTTLLNWLIILYAFSIPVSLDLIRILAPLILLVWIAEGRMREKFNAIKKEPLFKAFGLLIVVLLVALLWTDPENIKFGFKYITRYWYILPMFAIFTSLKRSYLSHVISAFLAGVFISVVVSYLIYFQIVPFEHYQVEGASPFMHHTLYSIFLVFSTGILLKQTLDSATFTQKILYGILFLLFSINLFINIGRAGHLLYFIIVPLVLFSHYRLTLKSVTFTLLSILVISYLAFTQSSNFKKKIEQTYTNLNHISYDTSLGARIGLNIVAKDIVAEHPLFGVGTGDYLHEKAKIVDSRYPDRKYVRYLVHYHNQYAEFAVIAGIFALLAYLLILIQTGRISITSPSLRTLKYILIVTFAMASLIDAMFHLNRPLSLFALFTGLLLAYSKYEEKERKESDHNSALSC
jgi:O-antigen ligase